MKPFWSQLKFGIRLAFGDNLKRDETGTFGHSAFNARTGVVPLKHQIVWHYIKYISYVTNVLRVNKASNVGCYNNRLSIDLQRLWTLLETNEISQKKKLCY